MPQVVETSSIYAQNLDGGSRSALILVGTILFLLIVAVSTLLALYIYQTKSSRK
ncbi:hypothetical protein KAZ66_04470 [Candidatus Woesebacteria bacterium]|nr:hypothetical protein [Candidatus Woesebacteria bacterium]